MVESKTLFLLASLLFVGMFNVSCKGAEPHSIASGNDTLILAAIAPSFSLNTEKSFYQAKLTSSGKKVLTNKRTMLLLEDITISENPDGVYELYLSGEMNDKNLLSPSDSCFINLLDLYALTDSNNRNNISIDITKKISRNVIVGEKFPELTVTILFRGNILPDKADSKQAGRISVKKIKVIQVG
jgi:hypothetical protein